MFEKRYKVPGVSNHTILAEYFQVFCGDKENFYMQNVKNESLSERVLKYTSPRMNLLIFQIDTLSRAHFMRRMVDRVLGC